MRGWWPDRRFEYGAVASSVMRTGTARNERRPDGANAVSLHWVDEGDPDGRTVVLVNGAGSTAVAWCRELIDPLLEAGYRVIRFDNRDVGRSTRLDSARGYLLGDMADDLGAVLDAVGVATADIVGRSMGGAIALTFAIARPERVRTMGLIYTSPCLGDPGAHGLPGPKLRVLEAMAEAAFQPPPADDAERIERSVAASRLFVGSRYPFDEAWARAEAEAELAHAPYAEPGHGPAVMASPSLVPALSSVGHPVLVVHGSEDPVVPVEHGRFLASALPNATYVELDGLGHELPPAASAEVAPLLLRHMALGT